MPLYRATFFFQNSNNYGWTETIYSAKTSIVDALAAAQSLARLRISMLGTDAFLTNLRVSDDLVKRDSFVWQNPSSSQGTSVHNAKPSDIPNTCLVCRMESGPQYRRTLYIRGQEDDCTTNGGVYTPTPNFVDAFDQWANELITNGWSIRHRNLLELPAQIATAVQTLPDGIVTVTTATDTDVTQGGIVLIKGCVGATQLNGEWTVLTKPSARSFTVKVGAIVGTYFGGGNATAQAFLLDPINNVFVRGVSHRITGRPFAGRRGRRTARTRT